MWRDFNRLTGKTYSDSTPPLQFAYDGNSPGNCTPPAVSGATNLVYRRSSMCDGAGASSWSYDPMGRETALARTLHTTVNGQNRSASLPAPLVYTYNYLGGVSSIQYPSRRRLTYLYNAAGRPTKVGKTVGQQELDYVSGVVYTAHGEIAQQTLGRTSDSCYGGMTGA